MDEPNAPKHLIRKIDRAFDAVTSTQAGNANTEELIAPPTVRRRRGGANASNPSNTSLPAGGFLPPSPPTGGGFLLDDQEPETKANHIPLSLIPHALQLLDLPPADEDVLKVFRNAASGWDGSREGSEMGVSRKDWRAVCLALLPEEDTSSLSSNVEVNQVQAGAGFVDDDEDMEDDSDDQYREENDEEDQSMEEDQSEDEYTTKPKAKSTAKGNTSRRSKGKARESSEEPKLMTRRQKVACREAFALFFPEVKDKELDSQRIMIKDIARVSGLLKEKVTAEEVVDMLKEFSTSADNSMSLSDFERMMMAAKLA